MKNLQIGVIGAGGIAYRKGIPGLQQARNCTLTAVMDVVDAERLGKELGVPAYSTVKDLLADSDVDAVYIASPVSEHLAQVQAAAEHGKSILCEKPLTKTVEEAEQAVQICRQNDVILQEGYMMKFHGAHQLIKSMLDSGRIGKIVSMRAQLSCWYPPIPGAWRQDPAKGGGGCLMDMATHLLDLLEFFAGPIKRLGAITGNQVQDYKSEDSATLLLEFKSGAHATIDSFFCIPDDAVKTRLEIYGAQGSFLTEGTIGQSLGGTLEGISSADNADYDATQNKDVERNFSAIEFVKTNPYTAEFEYFANHVMAGEPPALNSGASSLHIMRLTELAYKAALEGRILTVDW